jgi:hypothetical protein
MVACLGESLQLTYPRGLPEVGFVGVRDATAPGPLGGDA